MKNILVVCFLFLTHFLYAQELSILSKIEQDSVSIKWLPANFTQFHKILEGAKIYRIESDKVTTPSTLDFSNSLIRTIEPTLNRYNQLNSSIEEEDKFIALLSAYYEGITDKEAQNFAFGTAVIENVINPKFQFVVGNIFIDKTFKRGKSYYYKVEISDQQPLYVFVNTYNLSTFSSIEDFNLILDLKKTVEATWNYQKIKKEAFGFVIEHSIDDSLHANNLLKEPYLPFKSNFEKDDKKGMIRDDFPKQGHFNYYRIKGLDPFGVPTFYSKWEKIYVPLLINAWIQIDTIEAKKENRIIYGHIFTEENRSEILNIALLRSTEKDSNYQVMETRVFNDTLPVFTLTGKLSDDHFYYKLIAYNEDDTIYSLPYYHFTLDQQPPAAPMELKGVVDSSGVVTLEWMAPADDDLQGYRVFRANAKNEEFVEQTKKLNLSTIFKDTIRLDNLSSDIYYYVKAVDDNYNNSISSDTALLIKPDTIPPVSAFLVNVSLKDTTLIINWVNSNSEDLKFSKLIRYDSRKIDTLFSWNDTVSSFVDYNLNPGTEYSYSIKTFDKSLNAVESKQFMRFYEPGYRNPLKNVNVTINQLEKGIELIWDKPTDTVFNYVIYRAKTGEKLLPLKTISSKSPTRFIDKTISINNKYHYSIKYINEDGIHSLPVSMEIIYQ